MAQTPKKPEDDLAAELLLKDADDALRQDQLNKIWEEWGSTIIGVALMIVFGTMIGVGWQNWRYNVHTSQTQALIESQSDVSGSYKGVSNLVQASQIATADTPLIMYNLMAQATDSSLPREWDILAEWGTLRVAADLENADQNDIADKMITLSKKRNNPYAPALMMEAAILKGENNMLADAISILNDAKNHNLAKQTPALLQQIDTYLHLYELKDAS